MNQPSRTLIFNPQVKALAYPTVTLELTPLEIKVPLVAATLGPTPHSNTLAEAIPVCGSSQCSPEWEEGKLILCPLVVDFF